MFGVENLTYFLPDMTGCTKVTSLETARDWMAASTAIVGFSGAGISTESGIPDFRSPGGVWSQNRTVMFDEFLQSREGRVEYWRQKAAIWPEMRSAEPNAGHLAFTALYEQGRLKLMITQNIEGLHQRAGLPDDRLVELHGTTAVCECLSCSHRITMDEACERVTAGDLAPECDRCGGLYKPATISFGQNLKEQDMMRAADAARDCDVMIAVGSSLQVQPAAGFPVLAKENGAKLVIINRDPTPLDSMADLVVHDSIGTVLPELIPS